MIDREYERQWHLDKKVPIALIVTLLLAMVGQTIIFVSWKTGIDLRVEQLEKSDMARSTQADRIIRLETRLDAVFMSLDEIKHLLRTPPDQRR